MRIVEVTSLTQSGVDVFSQLTESQLRNRLEPDKGVFIAESPKVILVALQSGYIPTALLCEERHIDGDAKEIIRKFELQAEKYGDIPVFYGSRDLLAQLTGYTLTRGVLCAMRRPAEQSVEAVCEKAQRIVVIDNVVDSTNIGAIFRSAAALGIDAVLLTRNSCDPLNRRAVRVSMGSVFLVPWTWIEEMQEKDGGRQEFYTERLRRLGFKSVAMALSANSIPLDSPVLAEEPRLAVIMGTEGDGLKPETIGNADYVVRIPMAHGVDSLNVAAASAVAFWQLRRKA